LTYSQVVDVVDAREAAMVELNRMLDEDEKDIQETPPGKYVHMPQLNGPSGNFRTKDLTVSDIEKILESAMGNHPEVFIKSEPMPEEQLQDALSAYGY